jgi:protein-tyrosine phosphatase
MGGYETSDGRHVKWGVLYRSGVLGDVSEAARAQFLELGIRTIFDLRTNGERGRRPNNWHHQTQINYLSRNYEYSVGSLDSLIRRGDFAVPALIQAVQDDYRELPFEQSASYRELFRLLIAGRAPLLFNCMAGKDRTGVAAALILFALGVPRQTIEHEYSLTEAHIHELTAIFRVDSRYAALAALPPDRYMPVLQADPANLALAFKEIERRHGSTEAYFDTVLGVGERQIALLRDQLLE